MNLIIFWDTPFFPSSLKFDKCLFIALKLNWIKFIDLGIASNKNLRHGYITFEVLLLSSVAFLGSVS